VFRETATEAILWSELESRVTFVLHCYAEELLAPRPNPQAGGPTLVACLRLIIQHILIVILQIRRPSPPPATKGRAVPRR